MTKLKLFVWTGFCPDWTDGLAFAIAKTEKKARAMIIADMKYDPYNWGNLEVTDIVECAHCVPGGG